MDTNNIIENIKKIHKDYKYHYFKILKRPENKYLMDFIENWSEKLSGHKLSTKLFWIFHDIHDFPVCKYCGKKLTKDTDIQLEDDKYHDYCSNRCAMSSSRVKDKRKNTNITRYGGISPFSSKEVMDKVKQTCVEKYGVTCPLQNEEIHKKSVQTCIERYGVEFPSQTKDFQERVKNTSLRKYGTTNPGCSEQALEKIRNTNMSRYGVEYSFQREEVREKSRQSNLNNWGSEYFLGSESRPDTSNTPIEKSYDEILMTNEFDEPNFTKEFYIQKHKNNRDFEFEFKCKKCGNIFKTRHICGIHKRCPKCFPKYYGFEEQEVCNELSSCINSPIKRAVKSIIYPYEIDMLFVDKNTGVEFDGLYWHSEEQNKGCDYHLMKTTLCEDKNIQLFHIFEDEWKQHRETVISYLKRRLDLIDNSIDVSKYRALNVQRTEYISFINENTLGMNEIQDNNVLYKSDNDIVFGFSYSLDDKRVMITDISMKNNIFVKDYTRLIKQYFNSLSDIKSIELVLDRRWYNKNMFEGYQISYTDPVYWLRKGYKRLNPTDMDDSEYSKVWDCGKIVVKIYESK